MIPVLEFFPKPSLNSFLNISPKCFLSQLNKILVYLLIEKIGDGDNCNTGNSSTRYIILVALNETEQELKNYFQSGIAMSLFHERKLTFGKAVQLSGFSRFAFEQLLIQSDIPFSNITADEVFTDLDKYK